MLTFNVQGLGRCAVSASIPRRSVPPSEEVRAAEYRDDFQERLHRAVIQAAKEARARGEIFDGITFDREVIQCGEL